MDQDPWAALDERWHEVQRRVRNRVRRMVRDRWAGPVGGAAFQILGTLLQEGPASPADLAARLDIRSSTMSAHLDRLEEAGWVERQPVAGASGRLRVVSTEAGREAFAEYLARRRAIVAEVFGRLDDSERRELERLLERVTAPPE
jgi:DNA-binding MarR family transcriptional regulator